MDLCAQFDHVWLFGDFNYQVENTVDHTNSCCRALQVRFLNQHLVPQQQLVP